LKNFLLDLVAWLVILPTSLVAGFWSIFAIFMVPSALIGDPGIPQWAGIALLFLLLAGWFGIYTLWKLYFMFIHNIYPEETVQLWLGLASGTIVSLIMICTFGDTIYFKLFFLGWPLIAVLIFSVMLQCVYNNKPNEQ
jgi:hypothetical protein